LPCATIDAPRFFISSIACSDLLGPLYQAYRIVVRKPDTFFGEFPAAGKRATRFTFQDIFIARHCIDDKTLTLWIIIRLVSLKQSKGSKFRIDIRDVRSNLF